MVCEVLSRADRRAVLCACLLPGVDPREVLDEPVVDRVSEDDEPRQPGRSRDRDAEGGRNRETGDDLPERLLGRARCSGVASRRPGDEIAYE